MNIRRRLLYAVVLLLILVAVAVNGYRALGPPGTSLLDALYMVVITLAGVGYGEIVSTAGRPLLRVFNMFVIMVGVMITLYVFSVVTAFLVEGELSNIFWRRKMQKRIAELRRHFIVCGLGATGRYAIDEFQKTGTPYVVIESNEEDVQKFREQRGEAFKEMLYVIGDATDEEVLDQAGLAHAKGVIAAVASDKDNLVITVTVRQKSPKVRIVARYADVKYSERMLKAGANATVSPNRIGGLRMASEALRPHVTGFLDLMLREQSRTLRIEEIDVGEHSPWVGRTLEQISLRSRFNLLVLAVKMAEEKEMKFLPNPPDNLALRGGTAIIVMGDMNELRRARHEAQHDPQAVATQEA